MCRCRHDLYSVRWVYEGSISQTFYVARPFFVVKLCDHSAATFSFRIHIPLVVSGFHPEDEDSKLRGSMFLASRSQCPAALSKAWIVIARSNTGIVGSNPTQGIDVCVLLFCVWVVLCVGSCLMTGWFPVQGVLPTVYRLRNWKSGQGPQGL
jgi:hypothetical protein